MPMLTFQGQRSRISQDCLGRIKKPLVTQCVFIYCILSEHTFVVHVGGHLDHAEAEVDRKVVEVIILLQDELPSQLKIVAQLIDFVNQHGIEVFILGKEREREEEIALHGTTTTTYTFFFFRYPDSICFNIVSCYITKQNHKTT